MPKAPLKSIPDPVMERAIRAAQENFELALVAEWDASADSPNIRNAMKVLLFFA